MLLVHARTHAESENATLLYFLTQKVDTKDVKDNITNYKISKRPIE